MDGNIYLKSQVGVGSEFYFSINYEKANEAEIKKESSKNIVAVKNQDFSKTILVVDDIKENRDLITWLLESYNFKTLQASSGIEALEIYKKEKIDLIFMDILMEGMNGIETILAIRQKDKKIPIIALSANVFEEDKNEAIKNIIIDTYNNHKRIIFNGNGYSQAWVEEAARRGLPNINATVYAIQELGKDYVIDLFTKHGIFTKEEIVS